jgi:glucokinase
VTSVVAVDVGGTAMKGALVDRAGTIVRSDTCPTPVAAGVPAVVAALGDFAADLADESTESVGVVVPGLIDEVAGTAIFASNIGWSNLPLREQISARLGLPVALGHDVRAGAVAEGQIGAAAGVDDFLFLPLGTGIAGGVVARGAAYAGAAGMGGEVGHTPVIPDGEPCACGQRGCLEVYASAAGIARRYAARSGRTDVTGARDVEDRMVAGDPDASAVWDDAVRALGLALATYTLTLDPSLIVIGGGLSRAGDLLFEPVRTAFASRLAFRPPAPIVPAVLGDRAGCLGAAIYAWRAAGVTDLGWAPATQGVNR